MTKEDYVIICGDFGGGWYRDKNHVRENDALDWLDSLPFTTLFVCGNHENFDRLYSYPVEEWKGGKVHKIRDSVLHLMRGQVFEIDGKKIFSFGGASSHDISGGILDMNDYDFHVKREQLRRSGALYRIKHLNWWKEELPSQEEMEEGLRNLRAHNNEVDYIVTHCCSTSTQTLIGDDSFAPDILTDYLEDIRSRCNYKKWFFGHYHDNRNVNREEILLWEQIIRIL